MAAPACRAGARGSVPEYAVVGDADPVANAQPLGRGLRERSLPAVAELHGDAIVVVAAPLLDLVACDGSAHRAGSSRDIVAATAADLVAEDAADDRAGDGTAAAGVGRPAHHV